MTMYTGGDFFRGHSVETLPTCSHTHVGRWSGWPPRNTSYVF